jgi:Leucine-rich repeat (LRR) protein
MDFLNKQLNENIETENIDLEFQQIESLSEIISLLCQFPNLKILNLHGNRIQSLTDLSPISQLQILDLSNNLMTVISP